MAFDASYRVFEESGLRFYVDCDGCPWYTHPVEPRKTKKRVPLSREAVQQEAQVGTDPLARAFSTDLTNTMATNSMDDARPATQVFALPPSLLEPKNTLWAKHKYLFNPRPSGLPSFKDAEEDIDRFQSESEEPVTRDNEYLGIHPRRARAKFIYEDRQRYREARQREKQGLDHDQALLLEWAFTGGAIDEKTRRATLRRRDKTKAPAVQRITMMATMPPAEIWKYKQVLRIEVARLARRTEEEARLKENEVQGLEEEVPRLEADCAREEADCAQEKARAQNEAHAREEVRVDTQRPNVMRRPRSEQPMREDDEEELERRRRRRSRENAQRERDGRSRGREGEDPRRGRGRLLVQRLSESYY